MITFATLFLGLVFGTVDVELVASRDVARVSIVLDGASLCEIGPPFRTALDLGDDLSPHELVATARDARGRVLGEARQFINRPRALAEAGFVLEPGSGGRGRVARLTWRSVVGENPRSVDLSFDGQPLFSADPGRIEIPPHVPERLHFLRATLDFGGGVTAAADAVFGGERKAETLTNLTAIAVELAKQKPLPLRSVENAFVAGGEPVRAVAVEEGPAELLFVVAPGAQDEMARMMKGRPEALFAGRLRKEQTFRLCWTVPDVRQQTAQLVRSYPMSPDVTPDKGGVLFMASHVAPTSVRGEPKVAMAVAAAALSAAGRDRRRAVILLTAGDSKDASELPPEAAALFLERLRVPFEVWSVAPGTHAFASRFGDVVDASRWELFSAALDALSRRVERQRIVWVEGTHLPQEIELVAGSGAAPGLSLAR